MDLRTRFDPELLQSDIELDGSRIAGDGGLATAVIVSLFTDARARPDDALPDATVERRGWWGDLAPPVQTEGNPHTTGSRLWLLSREKQTTEVLRRAEEYAREALQWLIDDGVATSIEVEAFVPRNSWLGLIITINRPQGSERFQHLWRQHAV
jgi:phage gp46-like protein